MPYITQNDLLQRMTLQQLTQLTDDAKTGQPSETVVSGVLEEASGKVDSYVRSRYTTPLQPCDTATTIARDIAVYLLYSRRPGQMPETVRQRYEDAMASLKDIASGKAVLDQPAGSPVPQSTTAGPVKPQRNELRFTDCNMEGFV